MFTGLQQLRPVTYECHRPCGPSLGSLGPAPDSHHLLREITAAAEGAAPQSRWGGEG